MMTSESLRSLISVGAGDGGVVALDGARLKDAPGPCLRDAVDDIHQNNICASPSQPDAGRCVAPTFPAPMTVIFFPATENLACQWKHIFKMVFW